MGTNSDDLINAVSIGTKFYNVTPRYILNSVYIKNLNADGEVGRDLKLQVKLNEALYKKTITAIRETCRHFGIAENVKVHVYSANINPKIAGESLRAAMLAGGADQVEADLRKMSYKSTTNDNSQRARIETNLHIATLTF